MNPTIEAAVEQSQAQTARLKELGKAFKALEKDKAKLQSQEEALNAELAELTGEPSAKPAKRRGRPAGTKNKVKAKSKTKTKSKSKSKKSTRQRGGSETGETREDIILRTLPTLEEGPLNKTEIQERLEKAGFASAAADPIVGVGQSLFKMKKAGHVSNKKSERGTWYLTGSGVKARDKALAEAEAAAA